MIHLFSLRLNETIIYLKTNIKVLPFYENELQHYKTVISIT